MRDPRLSEALPELLREGLLSEAQAARIRSHYAAHEEAAPTRTLLLFGVLGALLIGLGIMLVVAHNWDQLARSTRTVLAFLPMALAQGLVVYALLRKPGHAPWREGTAVFLYLAVGACMALVAQIHHLPGELDEYLLTWSLLGALLMFVPGSVMATLLHLAIITWYAVLVRTEGWDLRTLPWLYLPLLAMAAPMLWRTAMAQGRSLAFAALSTFTAISFGIAAQLFWREGDLAISLGIAGLATAYLLVPATLKGKAVRTGTFRTLGLLALLGVLFQLSYAEAWQGARAALKGLGTDGLQLGWMLGAGIVALVLSKAYRPQAGATPFALTLPVLVVACVLALQQPALSALLVNLWLLLLGVRAVQEALRNGALGRLNLGLAILGITILMRFFDLQINDALKGLVFILLGAGSLLLNLRMLKRRSRHVHP